jgi:hydrogenase maturation protein HypF
LVNLESWRVLRRALQVGANAPLCCSVGRLFDCVAAILGIRGRVGYEGQAAVELETVAIDWIGGTDWCRGADSSPKGRAPTSFPGERGSAPPEPEPELFRERIDRLLDIDSYDVRLAGDTLVWEHIVRGVLDDALRGEPAGFISARFHRTIAEAVMTVARAAATHEGIETVALTGGSFVNTILHYLCSRTLSREGFAVLAHALVPPNDGGIAYGQAAVAAARLAAAGRGGGR